MRTHRYRIYIFMKKGMLGKRYKQTELTVAVECTAQVLRVRMQ